jgi:hypothetical protein
LRGLAETKEAEKMWLIFQKAKWIKKATKYD